MKIFKKDSDFVLFNTPSGLVLGNNKVCLIRNPVELWSEIKLLQSVNEPVFFNNVRLAKIES